MANYVVNMIFSTCVAIEVEARDEEEAKTLALKEADPYMTDPYITDNWNYDIYSVVEKEEEEEEEEDEEEE